MTVEDYFQVKIDSIEKILLWKKGELENLSEKVKLLEREVLALTGALNQLQDVKNGWKKECEKEHSEKGGMKLCVEP